MKCYLCEEIIPADTSFYNDLGFQVCRECFKDAPRCFICRFPGKEMQKVEGLGHECEFCRGNLIAEGDDLAPVIQPVVPFLTVFGMEPEINPEYGWASLKELREMQTDADLPPEKFIDDYLHFCYPVYYNDGKHYCLKRMTKATFVVYAIVQLAAAYIAKDHHLPNLTGDSPFHTFSRGYCHYIGFEAARRLNYDLEWRQLRKWPKLGMQGDFDRWKSMSDFNNPRDLTEYLKSNLNSLAKKHLIPSSQAEAEET